MKFSHYYYYFSSLFLLGKKAKMIVKMAPMKSGVWVSNLLVVLEMSLNAVTALAFQYNGNVTWNKVNSLLHSYVLN